MIHLMFCIISSRDIFGVIYFVYFMIGFLRTLHSTLYLHPNLPLYL